MNKDFLFSYYNVDMKVNYKCNYQFLDVFIDDYKITCYNVEKNYVVKYNFNLMR